MRLVLSLTQVPYKLLKLDGILVIALEILIQILSYLKKTNHLNRVRKL